jgi:TolB-like protein
MKMLSYAMAAQEFTFGSFVLDPVAGTLQREGVPVHIGQRGLALLATLLAAERRVVGKAELMDAAWPGLAVEESNLSVQIAALRKILGPAPGGGAWIATVPRVGYRWAGPAGAVEAVADRNAAESAHRPGIAVLPFANLGGDRDQDYLADGISEDIIAALAQFRWFKVIARNSSFAFRGRAADPAAVGRALGVSYLLDGSVRRSGPRIRIAAHLIDTGAGTQIWAGRYDLEMEDVFAVQDDLAERVAGAIEPELLWTEASPRRVLHTGDITAWDLVRRGMWLFHQITGPTHRQARELFRQACARDPHLAEAHLWLGRVNAGLVAYGWSDAPDADRQEGLAASLRAIALDDRNPYAHFALAIVSAYSDRLEQAQRAAARAIELSPSFALGHRVLGMARLFRGAALAAIEPLEASFRLCPHDPQNAVWLQLLALAQFFAGRPEEALQSIDHAMAIRPDWRPTHELRAAICHALDRPNDARASLAEAARLPVRPSDALRPLWAHNPDWRVHLDALIHAAAP